MGFTPLTDLLCTVPVPCITAWFLGCNLGPQQVCMCSGRCCQVLCKQRGIQHCSMSGSWSLSVPAGTVPRLCLSGFSKAAYRCVEGTKSTCSVRLLTLACIVVLIGVLLGGCGLCQAFIVGVHCWLLLGCGWAQTGPSDSEACDVSLSCTIKLRSSPKRGVVLHCSW